MLTPYLYFQGLFIISALYELANFCTSGKRSDQLNRTEMLVDFCVLTLPAIWQEVTMGTTTFFIFLFLLSVIIHVVNHLVVGSTKEGYLVGQVCIVCGGLFSELVYRLQAI